MSAKEVEKEKEKRSKALRQEIGSQTSPAKRAAAAGAGAGSGEDEGSDGGGGVELEVRRELASMSYKNLRHMESGPKVRVSAVFRKAAEFLLLLCLTVLGTGFLLEVRCGTGPSNSAGALAV